MEMSQVTIKQEKVENLTYTTEPNFLDFLEIKVEPVKIEFRSLVSDQDLKSSDETKVNEDNDKNMVNCSFNEKSEQKVSEIKLEGSEEIEKMEENIDVKWEIKNVELDIKDEINIKDEEQRMEPNGTGKRAKYTQEDLENAIREVENGMSYGKASKMYKIPKTTLLYKRTGKVPMVCKMGPDTYLTQAEEDVLVKWMFYISDRGFPATKDFVLDSVKLLITSLKRKTPFTDGRPGRHWYESFLRRHPEVSRIVTQNLTNGRAVVTETRIRQWFLEVQEYLQNENLLEVLNDPRRIYNCNEIALYLCPMDNKVLVRKGENAVYNNDEKECITTLIMCNGGGILPPPMVLYKYKRIPSSPTKNVPKNWGLGYTDNGWMTGASFFEYVANVFYPWLIENNIELPIILFVDGHSSHMTLSLSEFCSKNKIILVCLMPNSTHIIQPLDVAFFRTFKHHWKKSVHSWRIENNGKKLTRGQFPILLFKALSTLENKSAIIQNGFRSCGLYPFTPDGINYEKVFKSSTNEVQTISTAEVQNKETNKYSKLLDLFSIEIPEKVDSFRKCDQEWNGDVEDKNVFYFWKLISEKSKIGSPDEKSKISQLNNTEAFKGYDTLISEVLHDNPSRSDLSIVNSNISIDFNEEEMETFSISKRGRKGVYEKRERSTTTST